jgi:crotonobetainyl-CoA:carnitine CoA-transferase CaiB-like acyl-CoA transferase
MQETAEPPLQGVKVLEIGSGVAVSHCCQLLAGYGADVVLAEDASAATDGGSYADVALNRGKRRVSVDDATLVRLAGAADVVVEGRPPGELADRGLDPVVLRDQRPQLVITSITPFGQTGPHARHLATNIVLFAEGGIMSLTGEDSRPPLCTGGEQALKLGGLHGFAATTVALYGALVQGEGDWIDISMQEGAASMVELYGAMWEYDSEFAPRSGNSVRAEWGVYPVQDGYAGVCCLERQVHSFLDLMAQPELDDPRFRDPLQRRDNNDELLAYVLVWMSERSKDELVALSPVYRIPFGAVRTPAELLDNESLAERGFFDDVNADGRPGRVPGRIFPGLPWARGRWHPAASGTSEVLADWLGEDR